MKLGFLLELALPTPLGDGVAPNDVRRPTRGLLVSIEFDLENCCNAGAGDDGALGSLLCGSSEKGGISEKG